MSLVRLVSSDFSLVSMYKFFSDHLDLPTFRHFYFGLRCTRSSPVKSGVFEKWKKNEREEEGRLRNQRRLPAKFWHLPQK